MQKVTFQCVWQHISHFATQWWPCSDNRHQTQPPTNWSAVNIVAIAMHPNSYNKLRAVATCPLREASGSKAAFQQWKIWVNAETLQLTLLSVGICGCVRVCTKIFIKCNKQVCVFATGELNWKCNNNSNNYDISWHHHNRTHCCHHCC